MSLVKSGIEIPKRKLIFIVYSFFYIFSFYIVLAMLANLHGLLATIALNFEVCIAILVSSFFVKKVNDTIFNYIAPFIIIVVSIILFITNGLLQLIFIFSIVPLFSVGFLIFFNYFQQITVSSERARISGVVALAVLPSYFILRSVIQNEVNDLYLIIFITLLSIGLFLFVFFRTKTNNVESKNDTKKFFEKKVVFLYLVPWLLFSIVNVTIAKNNSTYFFEHTSASFYVFLVALQSISVCFGAIIAGFVADFSGRRIALAVTLSLYGISAVLGGISTNPQVYSVMYFINGMSWGILFVMYIFVVWGDLANKDNCAKMYSLGVTTYFLSLGIGAFIPQSFLPISISSLLTCSIAFFSILPIFMVPELGPTNFMERVRLKRYANKIGKRKN
jgi:hypothetical protein